MLKIRCSKIEKPIRRPFKAANTLQLSISQDGKVTLSGEPKLGDLVKFKTNPADDGVYTLENDAKITIANGVITKITPGRQL